MCIYIYPLIMKRGNEQFPILRNDCPIQTYSVSSILYRMAYCYIYITRGYSRSAGFLSHFCWWFVNQTPTVFRQPPSSHLPSSHPAPGASVAECWKIPTLFGDVGQSPWKIRWFERNPMESLWNMIGETWYMNSLPPSMKLYCKPWGIYTSSGPFRWCLILIRGIGLHI